MFFKSVEYSWVLVEKLVKKGIINAQKMVYNSEKLNMLS
jgi:hypothetical protein